MEITDSQKGDLNVSLARCTDGTLFFPSQIKMGVDGERL